MLDHILSAFSQIRTWDVIGYVGTLLFASRFFVQWFKSEIVGKSVVPIAFWYFSIGGGLISLAYAIHIQSGPYIVGQGGGLVVYFRNLYLIFREKYAEGGKAT